METQHGFTFTRKTTNKASNLEFLNINHRNQNNNTDSNVMFEFKKVGENANAMCKTSRSRNAKIIEAAKPAEYKRVTRKPQKKVAIEKKDDGKTKQMPKNKNKKTIKDVDNVKKTEDQSVLQFNVLKKRKTIKLDPGLSFDSTLVGETQMNLLENTNNVMAIKPEDSLRIEFPVIKDKLKSNEIHTKLITSNLNDLIKECVFFLKDESKYAKEIIKNCNANYFSDIDYRKEIETTAAKIEQVKTESIKWNNVYEIVSDSNRVEVPCVEYIKEDGELETERKEKNDALVKEFEEKEQKLQLLNEKLRYFFENAKEKSELLLQNVFGSIEEKGIDALFLLKAMSKLGR